MGGQLDGIFLAGSLPHEFIILIVTSFICLWLINLSLTLSVGDPHGPTEFLGDPGRSGPCGFARVWSGPVGPV